MPDVSKLKQTIKDRTGLSDRQINRLISEKAKADLLSRPVATMAVARDRGISIDRYASEDDLAQLRHVARSSSTAAVPTQSAAAPAAKRTSTRATMSRPKVAKSRGRKKVFVVHGRNEPLRKDMFAFLRSIGLTPLEWHKGIEATEVGSPSIRQILDAMFEQAAAVVVLLTPDDTVRLKPEFQSRNDPAHEKKFVGQARPNVLFEAGMAFGSHPDSVVILQVGWVKPFTDVGGVHVTHMNNSPEKRSELAAKLKAAGCDVATGGSDWYSTGNFEVDDEKGAP